MSDTEAAAPEAQAADADRAASTVDDSSVVGLSRLFAAAALYPPTHGRIVEMAAPILAAARAADPLAPLALIVHDGRSADGRPAIGSAERLHRDLRALGIRRIEIGGDVTTEDLVACARFLRQQIVDRAGPGAFRHADLSALPATIRFFERRFANSARTDGAADPAPDDDGADDGSLVDELTAPDEDVAELVRRAVIDAHARAIAAPTGASDASDAPVGESATVRAVAETVRTWVERQSPSGAPMRTPGEILADARRDLPQSLPGVDWSAVLEGIRGAIDSHLRDSFRAEKRAEFDVVRAVATESEESCVPQEELVRAIAEFTAASPPVGPVAPADRAETLSLLLHVFGDPGSPAAAEQAARRLEACFAEPLGERERRPLVGWLRHLVSTVPRGEFDRRIAHVAGTLRTCGRDVAQVLVEACEPPHLPLATAIWPHIAFELVTGADEARETEQRALSSMLACVAPTTIREESSRLRALLADDAAPAAKSVFFPPREELHALYEILIDMPPELGFAAIVTSAFLRHPPSNPAAIALIALPPTDERTQRFVARLLREGAATSPALYKLAAGVLVGALRDLPNSRRGEEWVDLAIRALGKLHCAAAENMLREVRDTRTLLVFQAWPARARSIAAIALDELLLRAPGSAADDAESQP